MIKAVIFDFGQTLVDSADGFRAAEKEAQRLMLADFKPAGREEFMAVYRRIRRQFQERSNFSRLDIWEAVYLAFDLNPDRHKLEQWEGAYWERVKALTRIFEEVPAVLEQLARRYRVALITNTQGQQHYGRHRMDQFPELDRFFEVVIVAGEGGVSAKPDPEPFRRCLGVLGLDGSEAVYVGDDWRIDVCGAEAVGMHPVWLRHHSVTRNWPAVETAAPIITSLEDLLELEKLLEPQPAAPKHRVS